MSAPTETRRLLNVPKQKLSLLAAADEPKKRIQALSACKTAAADVEPEPSEPESLLREKLLAEFVGTFFLVLAVGVSGISGSHLAAMAIGGVLAVQIYTFASISGGIFNPAVTLAILLSGRNKLTVQHASLYVLVQLIAGVVGGISAYCIMDESFMFDWSLTPTGGPGCSFVLEVIFTMALCNIVLSASTSYDAPNQYFGAAIGGSVTFAGIALSSYDHGFLNPAVTLGINLARLVDAFQKGSILSGPSAGAWVVFLVAPLIGGIMAAVVFRLTRSMEFDDEQDNDTQHFQYEKVIAEFCGTFMLVLTVCLAVTGRAPLGAVAIGGMLAVQVYTFGSVSGGLFNPAVALAVKLTGREKLDWASLGEYMVAQFAGAMLAASIAFSLTEKAFDFDYSNHVMIGSGWASAAVLELLCTSMICSIVLSAGTSFDAPNQYFGFAIGCAVAAAAAGDSDYEGWVNFSQGSFNPALTVAVNLANIHKPDPTSPPSASMADGWVLYTLAPFLGALLSAAVFYGTRSQEYQNLKQKSCDGNAVEARTETTAATPASSTRAVNWVPMALLRSGSNLSVSALSAARTEPSEENSHTEVHTVVSHTVEV